MNYTDLQRTYKVLVRTWTTINESRPDSLSPEQAYNLHDLLDNIEWAINAIDEEMTMLERR